MSISSPASIGANDEDICHLLRSKYQFLEKIFISHGLQCIENIIVLLLCNDMRTVHQPYNLPPCFQLGKARCSTSHSSKSGAAANCLKQFLSRQAMIDMSRNSIFLKPGVIVESDNLQNLNVPLIVIHTPKGFFPQAQIRLQNQESKIHPKM